MTRNRLSIGKQATCLLVLMMSLTVTSLTLAGKPTKPGDGGDGGSGDSGPVPPGTIYYEQWEAVSGSSFVSMLADGSGKTPGSAGEPSSSLHDGERWFLVILPTLSLDPYGDAIEELFAVTDQGQSLQLTSDPEVRLYADMGWPVRWLAGDSLLSFMAFNAASDPQWQEAMFVVGVDWSTGSPVLSSLPQRVLDSGDGVLIGAYDWSPAGDEVVYNDVQNWDAISVKVTRFLADGSTVTRELGLGLYPTWSPDGSRIAFGSLADGAIWTIQPDGTGATKVSSPTSIQQHNNQVWSPDSQHLAFTQRTQQRTKIKGSYSSSYTYDILRISASGGKITNLTNDTSAECYPWSWR